jgi:RNA polymerase sigma factor (TIGR02999 family)
VIPTAPTYTPGPVTDERPSPEELFPAIYAHLHAIATSYARSQAASAAEPASLVHEAFLRMQAADEAGAEYESEEHFRAVAATAMRQILVDRARRRGAEKRGGGWERVTLSGVGKGGSMSAEVDLLALDEALRTLHVLDARQARIVELRFFGGMTVPEVARELELSESTIEKEWQKARAWLESALAL